MTDVVPLAVLVPLLAAALLAGIKPFTPRRVADVVAVAAAAATTVLAAFALAHAGDGRLVYWWGGWEPRDGVALGVSFTVDALGAGLALLVAVLALLALVHSVRFMREADHVFHVLMLVFLAGMTGFALAGDLFTMFVFFELLSVPAYALAGYNVDKRAPIEGSLNFAISNSIGAILVLFGIGLLYGATGSLNLAQMGEALQGRADGLVIVAFALVACGFFVKAAIAPFHFWLADAHAVAPAPVCMLFTGAMAPLGIYGVARVYWAAFEQPLGPHEAELRTLLVAAGLATAVLGAVMSVLQTHLKRLIAFITVSHMGVFLVGVGVLDHHGLAGSALYVAADGLAKAGLFALAGIVQHRLDSVDISGLHGRGRTLPATGALFVAGGLLLASLPALGPFVGKALIEEAAVAAGAYDWVPAVLLAVSALTGGAVLSAAARVFLGWGERAERDPASAEAQADDESESEAEETGSRTPALMLLPALLTLAGAAAIGLVPGIVHAAGEAAAVFTDTAGYAAEVLRGEAPPPPQLEPVHDPKAPSYLYAAGSLLGALAVAAMSLFGARLRVPRPARAVAGLRAVHSGHVGDYVAWLTVGLAGFGGLFALALG